MNEKSKSKIEKSNNSPNHDNQNSRIFDLENRTFEFARRINFYVNNLPKTMSNLENGKQLIKSGGSVGANYLEANESLSKKDFQMRIKISKKESKESRYWLKLTEPRDNQIDEKNELIQESTELMKIFASILEKVNKRKNKRY
ncbi:MAG: four helix bundle protein [Thermoplasmata archaeon]|nr:MAG: four helix bundle protein [Thermoplasmata archaeon]